MPLPVAGSSRAAVLIAGPLWPSCPRTPPGSVRPPPRRTHRGRPEAPAEHDPSPRTSRNTTMAIHAITMPDVASSPRITGGLVSFSVPQPTRCDFRESSWGLEFVAEGPGMFGGSPKKRYQETRLTVSRCPDTGLSYSLRADPPSRRSEWSSESTGLQPEFDEDLRTRTPRAEGIPRAPSRREIE
jgi:hypothetical protein